MKGVVIVHTKFKPPYTNFYALDSHILRKREFLRLVSEYKGRGRKFKTALEYQLGQKIVKIIMNPTKEQINDSEALREENQMILANV